MQIKTKGIVYVATKKERYVVEAFLSATSVRALVPDLPVTLFTDLDDSPFSRAPCFSTVVPIDSVSNFGRTWSEGQLDRIRCLPSSPYDLTLHLDSDTRVNSPEIASAFSLLETHDMAMVECAVDNSYSRQYYGRPMFNVGFMLFRKSEPVMRLLEMWEQKTIEFFDLAAADADPEIECLSHIADAERRRKLLFMDQLSMVQLLSPEVNVCGVDCAILDESWNYRGSAEGRPPPAELKVNHHPSLRKLHFGRDLRLAAMRYQSEGHLDLALSVLTWLDNEEPGQMDVMKLIVVCQVQMNKYDAAIGTLGRLLERYPGYPWAESARQKLEQQRVATDAGE